MGSSESTPVEPQDVVGEPYEAEEETSTVYVQYGPNIIGKLIGYDQRTQDLSLAAHNLNQAISTPSNESKHKVNFFYCFLLLFC